MIYCCNVNENYHTFTHLVMTKNNATIFLPFLIYISNAGISLLFMKIHCNNNYNEK